MSKILFLSHEAGFTGGAERSLFELVIESSAQGFECHVLLPQKTRNSFMQKLTEKGIPFSVISYSRSCLLSKSNYLNFASDVADKNATAMQEIAQVMIREQPDVVISNTITVPWAMYVARAFGIPHMIFVREWIEQSGLDKTAPTQEEYLANIKICTDWVLYNSNYTKSLYSFVFESIKSSIVYPMVGITQSTIEQYYVKNRIGKSLSILILGSLEKRKNQLESLAGIHAALKRDVKISKVRIVGQQNPEYLCKVEKYIIANNLEGIVSLEDHIENPFGVINETNILLVSSINETFGRVNLECQLFGRLVIGANAGGTAELIEDKITGILYELGNPDGIADALEWISNNPSEAENIARRAKEHKATHFLSSKEINDSFFTAIESVLNSRRRPKKRYNAFDPIYALLQNQINSEEKV